MAMVPITAEVIRLVEELDNFMEEILQRIEEYLWNEEWFRSDIYKYTARELEARQGWETPADYLERLFGDI